MKISGWGRYPRCEASVFHPKTLGNYRTLMQSDSLIARGLGRSYGDSANSAIVAQSTYWDHLMEFDHHTGIVRCEAGVSLAQLLLLIVPQGWFLPVTPGSSAVTVGGAIASDVHGKNHHHRGTFSQHVMSIDLLLGTGERVSISKTHLPELFCATCGGMGLTGIILTATLQLIPIGSSRITQTTLTANSLEEVCEQFEEHRNSTYSVAWMDCLSSGKRLGRSLLMLGEHSASGSCSLEPFRRIPMPFTLPSMILNPHSIRAFNTLYFYKNRFLPKETVIPLQRYFYPLDAIDHWNRMYGKAGFIQYQFVIPKAVGVSGLKAIVQVIAQSGMGSFLAVLKVFGKANANYLSFPMEGYTLALDFKVSEATFSLISRLDQMVLDFGGRLYLTKDALMSEAFFKASYPNWEQFEAIRLQYGAIGRFASDQSRRLGLG